MSNKVIVVFSDGSELPMQGPKTEQTLKLPVEEQAKIFYDAATKSKQGQGKTPVTFGQEGKERVPFSSTTKPQPSTSKPDTPAPARPEVTPSPTTAKPEVKPAPSTTAPATAPTAKPEPDSRINDLAKEWEEKAKAKAREEQVAREKAEQAAREKAEADRKEKAIQDLIAQKQKEADAAKSKQEADKKAKELEALRAQEAEAKATAEAKAKADEKAKADAEAAAKAKADADAKAAADKKNSPAQTAPSQSAPTPSTNKQEPAPAQTAPAQTATAQTAPSTTTAQPSKQPSKWDSLRKELGITGQGMAQPNNQPSTAIQGTTSNTPGTQPGAGNRPGTGNQSGTGTQPGTGNQPSKPAADPAQIRPGGRLPGDGSWKDLGNGTQKWVGPAGIDTGPGHTSGQMIQPGTIVRTPAWKGDDDLSKMHNLTDLEAIRADLRRQRRALDAAQKAK